MATKLQTLLGYSNRRIRDTWDALGALQVTNNTTYYTKGLVYQVAVPSSALNGYLVYANEDSHSPADWTNGKLVDQQYGEISFQTDIIDPRFTMVLSEPELDAITEPVDDSWIPFSEEASAHDIHIPEKEMDLILTDIGVPFISYDELEYSREQIVDLMIKPALEEYFKWFPKVKVDSFPINSARQREIEFPVEAYDVVHIGVNQGVTGSGVSNTLLRYFDEVVWMAGSAAMQGGFAGGGSRKPRTRTMDWGGMMLDRAGRQAVINYGTRVSSNIYRREDGKKILQVTSNKMGTLDVHWALKSFTWEDVEFARLPELRDLARANILRAFGSLRGQAKSDIPGAVDYSGWLSRGEALKERVLSDWKELVKFSGVIRGSH